MNKMDGMFAMWGKMTIFAVVSFNTTTMAIINTTVDVRKSLRILEGYEPLVLIDKLKSRDMKASHHFSVYIEWLMDKYMRRYLTPAHVREYKADFVADFYTHMFGERMRVDDLQNKEDFLIWIGWEVNYFVLNQRKKKKTDPVDQTDTISLAENETNTDLGSDVGDDEDTIEYTRELLEYLLDQINPTYAKYIRMSIYDGLKSSQIADREGKSARYITDKKSKGVRDLTRKAKEYKENRKNNILIIIK